MKPLFVLFTWAAALGLSAQDAHSIEVEVENQKTLRLDLPFADEFRINTWDESRIEVLATVSINDGEDNEMFVLHRFVGDDDIRIEMDRDQWEDYARERRQKCWNSDIQVEVNMPSDMTLDAETISGHYVLAYHGQPHRLKTISGDIDLSIEDTEDLDISVKTISGEVYSDLDITYPNGEEGLRLLVGMDVRARLGDGGPHVKLETISGNIYLRKVSN